MNVRQRPLRGVERAARKVAPQGSSRTTGGPGSEPLSPLDNLFLVSEGPRTHMHVAVTAIFDPGTLMRGGGVDIERIRDYIAARLHWIPRYRQRLTYTPLLGSPVWVDDERFNINYHVRHIGLPRPGDEQQLRLLAGRIKSQQLDREKPLWETFIVEGLEGGRFAMITKTHHCMIDGVSGADLLAVLLQPFPQEEAPPIAPSFRPRPAPTRRQLLQNDIVRRVGAPLNLAARLIANPTAVWGEIRNAAEAVAGTLPSMRRASDTPFNRVIGPHRRFHWLTMDLDAVKAVKNGLGGTVNDVVLATVAGAVRRFLQKRHVNVDGLDFRALVPVSVRRAEERSALGNRVAAWLTDLPVAERDPRTRFAKVRETTAGLKESKQATGAEVLAGVTGWTSSSILSLALRIAFRARPFNLVVTNVPGPQLPLYLADAPMRAVYPQVPLFPNQGLGVALFSYAGILHWGFNADWELMPDLQDFVAAIEASFAELVAAAGWSSARPAALRATARTRSRRARRSGAANGDLKDRRQMAAARALQAEEG